MSGSTQYGEKKWDKNVPPTSKGNTPDNPSPDARVITDFHKHADTDTRRESLHHTLGPMETQGSPGSHSHDGGTSKKILDGYNLTGSKGSPSSMWPSILACLVRLGAKDSTSA